MDLKKSLPVLAVLGCLFLSAPASADQSGDFTYSAADNEITITGYTSATVVSGTVVSRLPPSYVVTVGSSASFRVGDAVKNINSDALNLIAKR